MNCPLKIAGEVYRDTRGRRRRPRDERSAEAEPAERAAHGPDPAAGDIHGGAVLHDARRALVHGGFSHGGRRGQEQGGQHRAPEPGGVPAALRQPPGGAQQLRGGRPRTGEGRPGHELGRQALPPQPAAEDAPVESGQGLLFAESVSFVFDIRRRRCFRSGTGTGGTAMSRTSSGPPRTTATRSSSSAAPSGRSSAARASRRRSRASFRPARSRQSSTVRPSSARCTRASSKSVCRLQLLLDYSPPKGCSLGWTSRYNVISIIVK